MSTTITMNNDQEQKQTEEKQELQQIEITENNSDEALKNFENRFSDLENKLLNIEGKLDEKKLEELIVSQIRKKFTIKVPQPEEVLDDKKKAKNLFESVKSYIGK